MESISCRSRGVLRLERTPHYVNFGFQSDGKTEKLVPCDPVSPSLAEQFSVSVNSVTRRGSAKMRQRINVDAVDLENTINKIKN